jgi:hypothetical protein
MDDILVTKRLGANRTICLSTLTREQIHDSSPEYGGDDFGYFIYEVDHSRKGGVTVLARVLSFEAALRILQIAESAFGLADDVHTSSKVGAFQAA